jgi:DNA polymerase-3 subunit epsilon
LILARRSSWRSASFLVVDVETTGLDPRRDEVISFAAVPVEAGRVVAGAEVHGLVRPKSDPPPESVEIHGLRAADLAAAPAAPGALAPLAAALEGRIMVAHAAWIEQGFLRPHLRALGRRAPRRVVDTGLLWRTLSIERGRSDPGMCALSAIATALGLPAHRPHVAEGDALTTAQVFLALATHLEAHGRATVGALTSAGWQLRGWALWHPPGLRVRSG